MFFSIHLYSILFYHYKANKLVIAKKMFLSLCLEIIKKNSLVTVQYQTVKPIIQWKRH